MTTTQNPEITLQYPEPKVSDRTVKYIWKSSTLDKHYDGTDSMAGEQVELEFSHDSDRKQYVATMRLVWWQPNDRGFTVTIWSPFDAVNFPATRFHNQVGVARYGAKSFSEFQTETLGLLNDLDVSSMKSDSVLLTLIKKAQAF